MHAERNGHQVDYGAHLSPGDTRIYRLREQALDQLTNDHRLWVAQDKSYLCRAFGINTHLEIDYESLQVEIGDTFLLATDGVYEFVSSHFILDAIRKHQDDLNCAAKAIVDESYSNGSADNLTVQIVRVDELPDQEPNELRQNLIDLPFPPLLEARMIFDGFKIIRELHASSRSHVYLAVDDETAVPVVIKTPSVDVRDDPAYLERFLMEEWIARRINSPYVLQPCPQTRKRNYLYVATEFIDGRTLTQWMIDNPKRDLETVRRIVEQLVKGLRAFHRLEMLHQDLRPDNIMIDSVGAVKIIDFGSVRVAGVREITTSFEQDNLLGTAQYAAPEYFLGESGTSRSDDFSLGVITYQLLTGKLPYGTQVAKSRTMAAQRKLRYRSALDDDREIPAWIDGALRKIVHPNPHKRYEDLFEFLFDLRRPNTEFLHQRRQPLMERNPLVFWKTVSLILMILIAILLSR